MTGPLSQMYNMQVVNRVSAVEVQLRRKTGKMQIDLHYRGCRIRTCRRQIDLDELYRNCPWARCPFQEQQRRCECCPRRSIKWPNRYAQWDLTEPETTVFESELPDKRESKVKTESQINYELKITV